MARTRLAMIAAMSMSNGIGRDGGLPWRLKGEMAYFRNVTSFVPEADRARGRRNAVIMGRKTWTSIPAKFRPLKDRLNIVISSSQSAAELGIDPISEDVRLFGSLEQAIHFLSLPETSERLISRVFVIGGAQLYSELMEIDSNDRFVVDRLLVTRILTPSFNCDAFFPEFRTEGQIQEDFTTAAARGMALDSQHMPNDNKLQALVEPRWSRATDESLKTYLGSSRPSNITGRSDLVMEEDGTQYEYQMWERTK